MKKRLDTYSIQVFNYQIDHPMRNELVNENLKIALLKEHSKVGLIIHVNQVFHYTHHLFLK